jgi:plasmid stability protein
VSYITLRNLPDAVEKQLRALARAWGMSLNKTIITVLARALGMTDGKPKARDLSDLAGTWSEEETNEFDESTRTFEQIDESMWES